MLINIVTLFPEMFSAITDCGVTSRAVNEGLINLRFFNPREFAKDKHRTVDDKPYGGGPGMLMKIEPLVAAIKSAKDGLIENANGQSVKVAYLSPQGKVLDQAGVEEIASRDRLVLLCGRYQGIDQRVIDQEVDEEWSIGDYILSGGEVAACVIIDAVARMVPGVLGHEESNKEESFSNGYLEYPHYTRPEKVEGVNVPEVLLSGNHEEIRIWREKQSVSVTNTKRSDLIKKKLS